MNDTVIYREEARPTSDGRQIPARDYICKVVGGRKIDEKYVTLEVVGPPELLAERPKNKPPKRFSVTRETLKVLTATSNEAHKRAEYEAENEKLRAEKAELEAKLKTLQGGKPVGVDPASITVDPAASTDDLDSLTKAKLLELAGARGISVDPKDSKAKIIEALRAA